MASFKRGQADTAVQQLLQFIYTRAAVWRKCNCCLPTERQSARMSKITDDYAGVTKQCMSSPVPRW